MAFLYNHKKILFGGTSRQIASHGLFTQPQTYGTASKRYFAAAGGIGQSAFCI
jgi:hypothetical protein